MLQIKDFPAHNFSEEFAQFQSVGNKELFDPRRIQLEGFVSLGAYQTRPALNLSN